jgi:hypothetical protein
MKISNIIIIIILFILLIIKRNNNINVKKDLDRIVINNSIIVANHTQRFGNK